MSILDSDIMNLGHCLAGERFKFIVNGMNEPAYLRIKNEEHLKRSVGDIKHMFWRHTNSPDIIKENIENFPICDKPIGVLLQWIEISISREIKTIFGHVSVRKEDNAVFAIFKIADNYVRMISICAIEK